MSTPVFVQYDVFSKDLANKVHDLFGTDDTLKIALTNTAPNAGTHELLSDITEISGGNGYTSGGDDMQNDGTETGGTLTVTGIDITFLATADSIAQFRYMVLYNDTPSSPLNPLIGYWDHGVAVDLDDGESFLVDFGASVLVIAPA